MNNSIIFFHVPKTGGTTCLNIFEKEFKNKFVVDVRRTDADIKLLLNSPVKYDIIMGHNLLNIHEKLNYDTEYVTFIREPIDHFLSTFYYIKRSTHNRYYNFIKDMSIEQYLKSGLNIQDFDNYQTRVFGGFYEPNKVLTDTYNFEKNGEIYFNHAIDNLNGIQNIYLFEKFDDAILSIKNKFNLSNNVLNYKKLNSTNNRTKVEDLSDVLKERISKHIKYDVRLYEHVIKTRYE